MPKLDPRTADRDQLHKRLREIENIFGAISNAADRHMETTCPYRDGENRCTAKFSCSFIDKAGTRQCRWDGSDDYQLGWFGQEQAS